MVQVLIFIVFNSQLLGLKVEGNQIYAYKTTNGEPCNVVSQGPREFYFVRISEEEYSQLIKAGNKTVHFWYLCHYKEVPEVPTLVPLKIPEDLVPFQNSPSFTRPSLLPIEAAVDAKLYDLVPGFGLFLGSQDAAHNDDVRQNSLLDLRRSSVGPIVSKLHLSSQCGDRDHLH
eukprot:TRINITY_DN16295_c0_g1_i13.p1 TRINITY_DN16295_c0_g1~~TRINITY_DN16295_c0_g1_i13.p1  ORF type:complete len:173 (-),score=15.25 TRINITY_DN16295_c0_g1_i13:371-889(-)